MRSWLLAALALLPTGAWAACPGYTQCPVLDLPRARATPATQDAVDAAEAATLRTLRAGGLSLGQLVAALGQALVFDRSLSVNGREACALCHFPATGFTAGPPLTARIGGIMPGAVAWRAGFRAPQSLAYAAFAPAFGYRATTHDFAGGNFWDSRATGAITGSAAADQAMVPLTSPFEMALPDPACTVRRVEQARYGALFFSVWGAASIAWPANTDARCARPADGRAAERVNLAAADRARATTAFRQIAQTIAAYEQSPLASPFAAKFDLVQAGTAHFTALEQAGYELFTGAAHCADCHAVAGAHALFTDFGSANIGVPANPDNPYMFENVPGLDGYVANPAGPAFTDPGLGGFLAGSANPQWAALAPAFVGAFQTPTLRNAAAARRLGHNGFFRNLGEMVHFLNTRDVLPGCTTPAGVGVTCWPAPEIAANIDRSETGNLHLTTADEAALTAFLRTLTDGAAP